MQVLSSGWSRTHIGGLLSDFIGDFVGDYGDSDHEIISGLIVKKLISAYAIVKFPPVSTQYAARTASLTPISVNSCVQARVVFVSYCLF